MRILTFTTLYPNNMQSNHGLFVEHRLANLLEYQPDFKAMVMAPVPWFPFKNDIFGNYGRFASVDARDVRRGIGILHPRYPIIPKFGTALAPTLLAASCFHALRKLRAEGWDFDVIDAHYFYPDGVAAVLLGRYFNRPVVVTARGTDVNLLPRYRLPRRQIKWAIDKCDEAITVCEALRTTMIELGASPEKVRTLRNGVDLALFRPLDRLGARERLGIDLDEEVLVSVGHLVERKGHHIVIDALKRLKRKPKLLIVGDGEMRGSLIERAENSGVAGQVRFCGAVAQSELPWYYSAADSLVLASSREGMANVLLESFACGTPAVATNVWGTPEVLIDGITGKLVHERSSEAIASGLDALLGNQPARADVRRYAENFSWEATSRGQVEVFAKAIAAHSRRDNRR